jgi:hypothetical protein
MDSCEDTLAGGLPHSDIHGSKPARGSPWLFAACHVLHRLLVPRHPPNALLILDTRPSAEADRHTMHRNHPQTALETGPLEATPKPRRSFRQEPFFAHNRIPSGHRFTHCSRIGQNRQPDKIVHTPLNPRRRPLGRLSRRTALPVRHATERRDFRQPKRTSIHHTRPETHQNLIHPDKEHNTRQMTRRHASRLAHQLTDLGYSTIRRPPLPKGRSLPKTACPETICPETICPETAWWRRSGSNRRPPACKAGALPAELRPQNRGLS